MLKVKQLLKLSINSHVANMSYQQNLRTNCLVHLQMSLIKGYLILKKIVIDTVTSWILLLFGTVYLCKVYAIHLFLCLYADLCGER